MKPQINRRLFLKTTAGASVFSQFGFNILHAQNKGDKLRLAIIGTGGKGGSHLQCVQRAGDIVVAHCDIDANRQGMAPGTWPASKFYQDYRQLFDKEIKNIDAVMVATPDHSHYQPTALAMAAGKHCYTQKPLVHTVGEARQLNLAVEKHKVATQMGNQGHAGEGNRLIYEYVNGGMHPVPANVNWDLWLGPAPERPYKNGVYHDFKWRGFYDFGGGALADMACHTMDSIFWSMNPGVPKSVEVMEIYKHSDDMFPSGAIFRWVFPAGKLPNGKARPELTIYWYEGKLLKDGKEVPALERVRRPAKLEETKKMPQSGNVYFGSKADLLIQGDYGDSPRIVTGPDEAPVGKPPQLLERNPAGGGDFGQYAEWRLACVGEKDWKHPGSNFTYAAPFTEAILLGNIALRKGWEPLRFS
ncbi:MAG: Gfo/Idh/MocA family oxidoreductase [Verrucomicrobia bacterium]|nr:Gfo/Idh/MocA family oxidoreductase [Verrucomicrobiota bacterium]